MIPRVLAAPEDALLDQRGHLDPAAVLRHALCDEKPGGHGDRAGAAGAVELACWDLAAKLNDEPAYGTIARRFGRDPAPLVSVYAAGGYYYPGGGLDALRDEMRRYLDLGYDTVKMKIGGVAQRDDLARIEAVIDVVGADRVAVDANGRFDRAAATRWAARLAPYGLRWYEEPGDPLDFELNRAVTGCYAGTVATGENLFSVPDVTNLVRYGGMRAGRDIFQMDAGLSYGLGEHVRMLELIEAHGFDRRCAYPHGGHMINLHIAAGLGLGGCESYPGVFRPSAAIAMAACCATGRSCPRMRRGSGSNANPALAS